MEENKVKSEKQGNQQKLTYEQLNDACQQLFQQNQQLIKQVRELNLVNMYKRLDYLFKIVELSSNFKDADFVNSCIDEIKEAITIPDNKEEKEK
jgi:hypothetical protein